MVTLMERLAIELIQIPLEKEPLRQHHMDKMYKAWGTRKAQQLYQIPYRLDFWGKLFSKHLAARGLLHNIPREELQEFFMNNLYRSKQIDAYLKLQIDHNHVIEQPAPQSINIYEENRDKHGVNRGRWLTCVMLLNDNLRYIDCENEKVFTSVPALQSYIIQSHFETYENTNQK
jgi:L-rhamnose isomerase